MMFYLLNFIASGWPAWPFLLLSLLEGLQDADERMAWGSRSKLSPM